MALFANQFRVAVVFCFSTALIHSAQLLFYLVLQHRTVSSCVYFRKLY